MKFGLLSQTGEMSNLRIDPYGAKTIKGVFEGLSKNGILSAISSVDLTSNYAFALMAHCSPWITLAYAHFSFCGGGGGGVTIKALSVFITNRPARKKEHLFIEIISMDLGKYMAF